MADPNPTELRQVLTWGFAPVARRAPLPATAQQLGDALLQAVGDTLEPRRIIDDGSAAARALITVARHAGAVEIVDVRPFGPTALEQVLPQLASGPRPLVHPKSLAARVTAALRPTSCPTTFVARTDPAAPLSRLPRPMRRAARLRVLTPAEPLARLRSLVLGGDDGPDVSGHSALFEPAILAGSADWSPEQDAARTLADAVCPLSSSPYLSEGVRDFELDASTLHAVSDRASEAPWHPPLGDWLAGPLLSLMRRRLDPTALRRQAIFKAEDTEKLIDEHKSRWRDHTGTLWALLVFQTWCMIRALEERDDR